MDSDGISGRAVGVGCCACTAVSAALMLMFASVRVVPPAQLGLVVTFGNVRKEPLYPGMHFVNPFASTVKYSTKATLFERHHKVPTTEGLIVDLDVAVLFHVDRARVRDLHLTLGEGYVAKLVEPELASAVRGLTSQGKAEALYNNGRQRVQSELVKAMKKVLEPRGLIVETVLLKGIRLPKVLQDSIETKAKMEQEAMQMDSVLEQAKKEAERKAIEAEGIANFQEIVSKGISKELLQWKGIEATEKFSDSKNSKIVLMGNSKASLPVLMNGD